jgi:LysM repeat protein
MKKFLTVLVVFAVILGIYSEEQFLWCKKIFMNEPSKHVIQKGEYFSKLSQQFYGSAEYWRELALVNRAPDSDLIFPGEEIVVPSMDAIRRLQKSRSLSSVNKIVSEQEDWMAHNKVAPTTEVAMQEPIKPEVAETASIEETKPSVDEEMVPVTIYPIEEESAIVQEESKSSALPIILVIFAIIVGAVLLTLYLRKRKSNDEEDMPEDDKKEFSADEIDDSENIYTNAYKQREKENVLVS